MHKIFGLLGNMGGERDSWRVREKEKRRQLETMRYNINDDQDKVRCFTEDTFCGSIEK